MDSFPTLPTPRWRQVLALLLAAALLALCWLAPLDERAALEVDAGFKRAVISFAAARALNGAISVAQGTEISAQPLGVGVTLTPGQILDPVNDLVEQFADLMLAASIAFGVEKVLLAVGGHWAASALLSVLIVCWLGWRWHVGRAPPLLDKLLLVALLIRFAVPLATLGSEAVFTGFMAEDYRASQAAISLSAGQAAGEAKPPAADGFIEQLRGLASKGGDLRAGIERLETLAERITEHVIGLIVIFLLQTLVLPLLLIWGLATLLRSLLLAPGNDT